MGEGWQPQTGKDRGSSPSSPLRKLRGNVKRQHVFCDGFLPQLLVPHPFSLSVLITSVVPVLLVSWGLCNGQEVE